jgi:hypothetical protein
MRDYFILYEMFQEDIRKKGGRFGHAAYSGFEIIDYTAFDAALSALEEQVLRREQMSSLFEKSEILLIEFARSNYREALKAFSNDFLRDAYFFYIEADVDTCVQRIQQRVASFTPEKRLQDHHYVPEAILRSYFNQDDWDYMAHKFKKDFGITKEVAAYRNIGSYIDLLEQVERFMELVFVKESIYTEQPVNV